jgi:hypothetical protein
MLCLRSCNLLLPHRWKENVCVRSLRRVMYACMHYCWRSPAPCSPLQDAKSPCKINRSLMFYSLLHVSLLLYLVDSPPGEATKRDIVGNTESVTCIPCEAPSFSFYPAAPECSQCLNLPRGAAAVCNGPAVVPANGSWQSHPRSPKVGVMHEEQRYAVDLPVCMQHCNTVCLCCQQ